MSCGAETEANELLTALLAGEDVTLPDIDLSAFSIPQEILDGLKTALPRLTNADLTETTLNGSGTFDVLMRGFKTHLNEEYEKNRITGQEYTKAYIAITVGAMSQAAQYLLQKDTAFWTAQTAQLDAYTAQARFETAKMQLATAKFEALNVKSTYALNKLRLATESLTYCTGMYNLETILPKQAELLDGQIAQQLLETDTVEYNLTTVLPKNVERTQVEIDAGQYNLSNMLPIQKKLLEEQMETQRSQTLDNRSDGIPVTGSVGKQKQLYQQQIVSYQRDAEVKAAKMWTDAWITMKTIDEGLDPPQAFINSNLNKVLQVLATNNNFGTMS